MLYIKICLDLYIYNVWIKKSVQIILSIIILNLLCITYITKYYITLYLIKYIMYINSSYNVLYITYV